MKLILIIAVALIAISLIATFLWPLLMVLLGAALVYFAYKNLTKTKPNALETILWIAIAIAGVSIIVSSLPGLTFIIALLVAIYFIAKIANSKSNQRGAVEVNGPVEAEWREV